MSSTSETTAPLRLEARGVAKRFGSVQALLDGGLELRSGEVHALLGENGAGKSTLLKVLSGVHRPDAGELLLDGQPYVVDGPLAARQAGVAMIHQELALAPELDVASNVALGQEPGRWGWLDRASMRRASRAALDVLGQSDLQPDQRVGDLGPGQRQLVEIARALAGDSRVLILDEPTSSLTRGDVERLFGVLRKLVERGVGVIYVSHFLDEVHEIANRVTVLRDGSVVGRAEVGASGPAEWVDWMTGGEAFPTGSEGSVVLPQLPPQSANRSNSTAALGRGPLLSVRGLTRESAPRGVQLELARGEVLGIAGLMGSGRSELLRCLAGLDEAREGTVELDGRDLSGFGVGERLGLGMGLLSEDRRGEGLATDLPLSLNLALPRLTDGGLGWVKPSALHSRALPWMERLGIRAAGPAAPIYALSGGNQQKVAFARLLELGCQVLLLDEPTRGIDVRSRHELYRWIRAWAAEGRAAIVVSSYFPELLTLCDRIGVMHRGRLSEPLAAEHWTERDLLEAAATGTAFAPDTTDDY